MKENQQDSGWTRPEALLAMVAAMLLAGVFFLAAQDFRITHFSIDGGQARLQHEADANSYYILYRGDEITNIVLAIDLALGQGDQGQLTDPSPLKPAPSATFYRVRKVPLNQPLDSDGDGIDDVYELRHRNFLNPLDRSDAALDFDGDGVSNLAEYQLGTDPTVPLPRPVVLEPASGASEVGVTVRPKATFPQPIDISTLNENNFFASFASHKLPATTVPANDGAFAWLFFDSPMPGASQIMVTVDGTTIRTKLGQPLDVDADGLPGGMVHFNFSTVSIAPFRDAPRSQVRHKTNLRAFSQSPHARRP